MLKMPSDIIFRIRSKGLNAMKKASETVPAPNINAMTASLITPSILEISVIELMDAAFLIK